jgi:putative toxin-antitoxin system antitoxin component (TIGR02293 family)
MAIYDINKLMGIKKSAKYSENELGLLELVNSGITKNSVLNLANTLDLSISQITKLLPITERTFHRYAKQTKMSRYVTEQIIQMAQVAVKGMEVFEERDAFLVWLKASNKSLKDIKPLELLRSRFGCQLVLKELGRIEYGVVA